MKRSNRLMLLLGVALAAVAFVGVLAFGSSSGQAGNAEPPPVQTVAVVTTTVDVALGEPLTADKVTTVETPVTDAVDTFRDPLEVEGMIVRRNLAAGDRVTTRDFVSIGVLTATEVVRSLQPGQRAMAIQVDPLTAALAQAGDRVDVILSVTDDDGKFPVVANTGGTAGLTSDTDMLNNTSVKVLVQNVPVLAIIAPPPPAEGEGEASSKAPTTVSAVLALTPQQVELVSFTQLDGNLSLVVRSAGDREAADAETTGVTLRQLVDAHGVLPPRVVVTEFP